MSISSISMLRWYYFGWFVLLEFSDLFLKRLFAVMHFTSIGESIPALFTPC